MGPGLGAKMSASGELMQMNAPPHMSATSVHVTRVSHSCLLPPAWRLKDQQVGLAQALITAFPLGPAHKILCATSKSEVSIFPVL